MRGQLLLALAGAAIAVAVLMVRGRGRDPLAFLGAYFVLFGLGPALNYLLGNPIYAGVVEAELGPAALGVMWAVVAICVVGLAIPPFPRARQSPPAPDGAGPAEAGNPAVAGLLLGLSGYAVGALAIAGPALLGGTKHDRIVAAGPLHYQYLLLELLACSLYFLAVRTPAGRRLYWLNLACYVTYCLATAERDFLFVLFGVLVHRHLLRPGRQRGVAVLRLALAGLAATGLAAYLAAWRAGETASGASLLNQGSVMFTDSFVRAWVPAALPYQDGATYIHALLGLVPGWPAPPASLAEWLVQTYAPGSGGGYGFSLTAEAYLNFGPLAIPVVFGLLAAVHRLLTRRLDRGQFPLFLSVLFTIGWMYGFRGESATLVRLLAYGVVLFGAVHLFSARPHRRRWPAPASALAPAPAPASALAERGRP